MVKSEIHIMFTALLGLACFSAVVGKPDHEDPGFLTPFFQSPDSQSPADLPHVDGRHGTGPAYDPYAYNFTGNAFPPNNNISIWLLNVTSFRKGHAKEGGYNRTFDLSGLPDYKPLSQPSGELRIWGSNYIKDGPLSKYWAEEFKKFQPNINISYTLPDSAIAVNALSCKVADLGVGRPATMADLLSYEQVFRRDPVTITAATGSFDVYGWSPAYLIVVNKKNPLTKISMEQLDGVFGAARGGGYVNGTTWMTSYPYKRGPEQNIRHWGQLGLTGEWADKPIHPCGQQIQANIQYVFQNLVLYGSNQWVEGMRTFGNYGTGPKGDQRIAQWYEQVRQSAIVDPYSICIAAPQVMENTTELRELEIQAIGGGPFVPRTLETIQSREYPLINSIFFFGNKKHGEKMEAKSYEFLRFILSKDGQKEVQREGRYLPLTADIVKEGLAKLEPDA